jgi:NTE family protein
VSGAFVLILAAALQAGGAAPAARTERPRFGLVLSGGGARGIAHIGVLRALEDNGLRPDTIAATSIGAVVGALYASGLGGGELERIVAGFGWQRLFSGRPERRLVPVTRRLDDLPALLSLGLDHWRVRLPAAALADYRANRFLTRHLAAAGFRAGGDFDRLPIPFRAVATALDNGDRVVLSHGDLPRAVRASLSIPVLFVPVERDGRLLVDGGIADNIPVDVAREQGAEVVLAVDVTSPPLTPDEYGSLTGIANQVSSTLIARHNEAYAREADFQIRPDIADHSALDYSDLPFLIERGYAAGITIVGPLKKRLGIADDARLAPPPVGSGPELSGRRVAAVAVAGNQRFSERLIRRTFNIPLGVAFDMDKGLNALDKLFATGFFESCWMRFEPAGDELQIVVGVKEDPASALDFAAGYHSADKARGLVRFRNQNVFGLGERLDLLWSGSDTTRLLRAGLEGDRIPGAFVGYSLQLEERRERPRFFEDAVLVNRAHFDRVTMRSALARTWKRTQALETGLAFGRVRTATVRGLAFPEASDQVGSAFARFVWDKLDDLRLPSHGFRVALRGLRSLPALGADRDYWTASFSGRVAQALGRRSELELEVFGGLSGRDLPVYEQYRIGGPVLIPGRSEEELWGAQATAAALTVRFGPMRNLKLLARAGVGGVSPTLGDFRAQDLHPGAGLGAVYLSPAGPVSFEWGIETSGASRLTFSLGYRGPY